MSRADVTRLGRVLLWLLFGALATKVALADELHSFLCKSFDANKLQGASTVATGLHIVVEGKLFVLPAKYIKAETIELVDPSTQKDHYVSRGKVVDIEEIRKAMATKKELTGIQLYRVNVHNSLEVPIKTQYDVFFGVDVEDKKDLKALYVKKDSNVEVGGAKKKDVDGIIGNYSDASWMVFTFNENDTIGVRFVTSSAKPTAVAKLPLFYPNSTDVMVHFKKVQPDKYYKPIIKKLPVYGFVFNDTVHLWDVHDQMVRLFLFKPPKNENSEPEQQNFKSVPFAKYFNCDKGPPINGTTTAPIDHETTTSKGPNTLYMIIAGIVALCLILILFVCIAICMKKSTTASKARPKSKRGKRGKRHSIYGIKSRSGIKSQLDLAKSNIAGQVDRAPKIKSKAAPLPVGTAHRRTPKKTPKAATTTVRSAAAKRKLKKANLGDSGSGSKLSKKKSSSDSASISGSSSSSSSEDSSVIKTSLSE